MDRNNLTRYDAAIKEDKVALRKESVDRNCGNAARLGICIVALRKESVDRNVPADVAMDPVERRSPQGERG